MCLITVTIYICVCVCSRGGAWAGGEATLAIQRLPAGAQRVPAAATQAPQVPLHSHVTSPGCQKTCGEQREVGGEQRREAREKIMTKSENQTGETVSFLLVLLDEGLIVKDIVADEQLRKTPEPIGQRHRAVAYAAETRLSSPGGTTLRPLLNDVSNMGNTKWLILTTQHE